jgi:hypothetical protein
MGCIRPFSQIMVSVPASGDQRRVMIASWHDSSKGVAHVAVLSTYQTDIEITDIIQYCAPQQTAINGKTRRWAEDVQSA